MGESTNVVTNDEFEQYRIKKQYGYALSFFDYDDLIELVGYKNVGCYGLKYKNKKYIIQYTPILAQAHFMDNYCATYKIVSEYGKGDG